MATASGSCLCQEVAFRVELPSKWVAHCHCSLCRRAHGAAFVTWVGMDETKCRIDDIHGRLRWYRSSNEAERGFCVACGSTLFFRSSKWPGELHLALANFSEPVDLAPQAHVFFDSHANWFTVSDDLPRRPAASG
jgi:hypothetical protein